MANKISYKYVIFITKKKKNVTEKKNTITLTQQLNHFSRLIITESAII